MDKNNHPFVSNRHGLFLDTYFNYKYYKVNNTIKNTHIVNYGIENLITHNTNIIESTIVNTNFKFCTFDQTNFYKCKLQNLIFSNCYFSRINNFDNVKMDFYNKFINTNGGILIFNYSFVNNINFTESKFQELKFKKSKIKTFELHNSEVDELKLEGTTIDNCIINNSNVNKITDDSLLHLNKLKLAKGGLKCTDCGGVYNFIFSLFNKSK
jgi:uncharacterized protein YjbI with pentapeptide repeats